MIRLHYANRLENLIAPLADAVSSQQRSRPLDPVSIIIPSRVLEQFVNLRLSEAIGVAANLEFPFLRNYLRRLIEASDPKARILDVEELELALFESLRAMMHKPAAGFDAVRGYIEAVGGNESQQEVRTFGLAQKLARLFREYSISRRSMLHEWSKGVPSNSDSTTSSEYWQRNLWLSTFDPSGYLRAEWLIDSEHNWTLLPYAFDRITDEQLKPALPPLLHVFGLAYTGPAYARIFARIGRLTDLNIYALNPCREFWEDVEKLAGKERQSWVRWHQKLDGGLEDSIDPFALDVRGDTPALRLWARPGREYIRLLNELTDCDFESHFTAHDESRERSILEHVQDDILNREAERLPGPEQKYLRDDGSIRFLACPGVRREAEIVANAIWSEVQRNQPGRDRIRFHQIGVIVPDALYEEYLPHLETAFSQLHQLPMNIVKRGFSGESRVAEAVSLMLRLPLGRFSRDEMLRLLSHPAITGNEAEKDSQRWREWCDGLGIFFGADADDLKATYIPRDLYHWDQAIRRLALGVFMDGEGDDHERFFRSSEIEYLPFETSEEEVPAVASFVKTARSIISDAIDLRSRRLTVAQWARLLSSLILTHIRTSDAVDERIRDHCVAAIESIAIPGLKSDPVSYQVACEMVSARIADIESQRGQFTESGVTIGPLSALRSIPFKSVFLMGLNESDFPQRSHDDPMDLRHAKRQAGDVTPTERDRYLFLETILAARDRIRLSYIARDAKTGDRLEPSSVIRELQFILRGYVDADTLKGLTIEHPLSSYDLRYFEDLCPGREERDAELISYDPDARRGALATMMRQDLDRHSGEVPLPGRDEPFLDQLSEEAQSKMRGALQIITPPHSSDDSAALAELSLPLSALRKFLECPLQGAAQYALGMLEDDDGAGEEHQDEPVAQSILDRTVLLREVFWKARGNEAALANWYDSIFRIARTQGRAAAGPFGDAAETTDLKWLRQWLERATAGHLNLEKWKEVRIGRAHEFAATELLMPEISLTIPMPSPSGDIRERRVKIYGTAGYMSPSLDASMRCVLRKKSKPKDFLGPFLSGIALSAVGQIAGRFSAIVVGASRDGSWREMKTLMLPDQASAVSYLSNLVADLLSGTNHYFLPVEAVANAHESIEKGDLDRAIDKIETDRENEFAKVSSDYGPVRDARRFSPPDEETLRDIVQRRFGILRTIFVEEKQ